jgi:hypothetical protein
MGLPAIRQATPNEFPDLVRKACDGSAEKIILLGPREPIQGSINSEELPEDLQTCTIAFQLSESLQGLPELFAGLGDLTVLALIDTGIGIDIVHVVTNLPRLKSLYLISDYLGAEGAAALAALTQLTSLNLGGNEIGDQGAAALAALTQLTSLNLGYNKIGDQGAAALAALTQLTSLNLGHNKIGAEGAAALAALTQLTSLNLSENPLTEVTLFAKLITLETLDLRKTKVQDISPLRPLLEGGLQVSLSEYPSGDGVYCHGCPLIHPPSEIVQQGRDAVLNYLREIEAQGKDQLFEAKLLILGEGGAGKTSLLRRLYQCDQPLPREDESTKGIDIQRHDFDTTEGRRFRLNVWDFGGQQIYHATHQFFLTKNSLYVLVDDTRKDDKTVHDKGFKYWLEAIEVLSESSPVLIFQNEKSGRSKSIDEAGIKGRFPNVKDVFRGDLENPEAADQLRQAIRFHVRRLPHVGEEVPAQWLSIRAGLETKGTNSPFISQQTYFNSYAEHLEFDRGKALLLSRYLHDLGAFLHFQEDPLLKRTVILKNEWATEAVFRILDDEPVKAQLGRFTRKDCERIWADSTYADMHPELLALMEKFELCYKLPDQQPESWLAPHLLAASMPSELNDWGSGEDLVLTYRYAFLPKGMINRLIVRMHRFVKRPDRCWASGAFFEQDTSQLLVQTLPQGEQIELRARGPEAKALLSVIASDLDALNASFEGLRDKVQKLIPCCCPKCLLSTTPASYEERRLLQRRTDGKATIECPDSYEDVSVLQLLDGLRLDLLPKWATAVEKQPLNDQDEPPDSDLNSGGPALKTIRIFLASSSELKEDRDAFDLHFRQENDRLLKQGIYLEIVRWENFLDAMSETRLQDEYNRQVRNCDIFVSLFKTKTGKYTEEEFDAAYKAFQQSGKPLIYTFFREAQIPADKRHRNGLISLWDFQEKLSSLGHFHTKYSSTEDLQLQFKRQLDRLMEERKL